ncbi:transmembrane protein 272-like [Procambarus clarkii]|uniref:transmembrane protein 272 n=1 Tax=Procambarus clarkii TaxID=6728 RepID=UPI001E676626|nr:uncharacterized protein LOC123771430 isoform X2 [Procambarus clarkii]
MVERVNERSVEESNQEALTTLDDQPRVTEEFRQRLEQRIQQEQRQKSSGGGPGRSSQHFQQFEEASRKMARGNQLPRSRRDESDKHSYDGDSDDGGGCGGCLATLIQWPVIIAAGIIIPVFGFAFIIMGALNINRCKIEPMIPIWLIVQGVVMVFGIGIGGAAKHSSSKGQVSLPVKVVGFVVSVVTVVWFATGNFWVYQAWGQTPDYAHDWFENGCNKSLYNLAFVGVIVLDALFIISAIVGCIAFVLRGCKFR